jgi:hypothetical protein
VLVATVAGISILRYVVWQAVLSAAVLAMPPVANLMKRTVLQQVLQQALLSAAYCVRIAHLSRLLLSARAMAKCLLVLQLTPKVAR